MEFEWDFVVLYQELNFCQYISQQMFLILLKGHDSQIVVIL